MIILGSKSEDKLKILRDYLKHAGATDVKIQQVKADSGVSSQPLSKRETTLGAKNRARNAFTVDNASISIGLEGGLLKKAGLYHLICVVSIYDGEVFYTGYSQPIPLPAIVSRSIEKGHEFGVIIREYADHNPAPKENVEELISRYNSFSLAIERAFSKYQT